MGSEFGDPGPGPVCDAVGLPAWVAVRENAFEVRGAPGEGLSGGQVVEVEVTDDDAALGETAERPRRARGERDEVVHVLLTDEPGQLTGAAGVVEGDWAVVVADRLMAADAFELQPGGGVSDRAGEHVRHVSLDGEHDRKQAGSGRDIAGAVRRRDVEHPGLRHVEAPLHLFDGGDVLVAVVAVLGRGVGGVFAFEPRLPVLDLRTTGSELIRKRHADQSPRSSADGGVRSLLKNRQSVRVRNRTRHPEPG